jgi:ribose transport system ATP-binding protein
MKKQQTLFSISGISKTYPGVYALSGVDINLYKGEVHALVGENGAGKSTLARILSGLEKPTSGKMTLNGKAYNPSGKVDAEELGIRMVMQELNVIPTLSVAENIFLNDLPSRMGMINRKQLFSNAKEVMKKVGLADIDPSTLVGSLGVGQQQMVEIAAGISRKCELLFLDEPTAALTDSEIELLFLQIKKLKSEGVCIIYISHRMEEIKKVSDRITILRDGVLRDTKLESEVTIDEIIQLMVGRKLNDVHSEKSHTQDTCALRVKNLSRGKKVRNVSFDLYNGEILGFSGMMGSGRTELMRLIFGADKIDSGLIYLYGSKTPNIIKTPADAVKNKLAFLTEDRKEQGLLLPMPISVNNSLSKMKGISKYGWIDFRSEHDVAVKYVSDLKTKCHSVKQPVGTLSGGNQQKVVIAKWLYSDPRILIFDEPTRGIDVGAKFEIYSILMNLAKEGRAIIVISSDMLELFAISDRIAVMSNGSLAKIFPRGEWDQKKIMDAALSKYKNEVRN